MLWRFLWLVLRSVPRDLSWIWLPKYRKGQGKREKKKEEKNSAQLREEGAIKRGSWHPV